MQEATHSAVIVPVPAAERLVARHRERFDTAAGWGVPAHVTVLYPFLAPGDIHDATVARLREAVASTPRFHASWEATGWFGDDVLWLDPKPAEPFRALTDAVARAFPDHPPYGGRFDDVVPHLTVGHTGSLAELQDVERQVLADLPFAMEVRAASLWCGTDAPGAWHPVADLPLG
jgi:2'-5' RNA ligase